MKTRRIAALALACAAWLGCNREPKQDTLEEAADEAGLLPEPRGPIEAPSVTRDWNEIVKRDTLVAIMEYNSTSYLLYRGEALGYEYELLKAFANASGIDYLKVIVAVTPDSALKLLNRGAGDVIAARLYPTEDWQRRVIYTKPLHTTRMVIVQRDAPPSKIRTDKAVERTLSPDSAPGGVQPDVPRPEQVHREGEIKSPRQLAGRDVHVRDQTAMEERLHELDDSLTADIHIVEVNPKVSMESLVRKVGQGSVDLTVSPENVALLTMAYYDNLSTRPTLAPHARLVWAVRRNAPGTATALNAWIDKERDGATHRNLYRKYFEDQRGYMARVESRYLTSETGELSPFDALLKRLAGVVGWDWRLLASQAYQESRFDPRARSWAGAQGLLQLMPGTAREVGVRNAWDPEQNANGAVRYLKKLDDRWKRTIPDAGQRLRFVLASYNAGAGHVEDAQRLTEKAGGNSKNWHEVSYWLLQKSKPSIYVDKVVKYGFCRGFEPVTYVDRILDRFEHYKQFVRLASAPTPSETRVAVGAGPSAP